MHRHKFLRHAAAVLAAAALLAAVVLAGLAAALPDTLYTDGPAAELEIASMPYLTVKKRQGSVAADSTTPDTSANVTLTLFGTLPVKTVRAVSTERRTVQVCGTPFGVKLFSDGALVVAFSDRYTALGSENPAKAAGLRLGDLIVSANGRPVRSNEDLTAAIQAAGGAPLTVVYRRSGQPGRAARGVRRRARRNRVGQRCRRGLRQLHRQLHRPGTARGKFAGGHARRGRAVDHCAGHDGAALYDSGRACDDDRQRPEPKPADPRDGQAPA